MYGFFKEVGKFNNFVVITCIDSVGISILGVFPTLVVLGALRVFQLDRDASLKGL